MKSRETNATVYEVLIQGDKGRVFGQTFATYAQAEDYRFKMQLAGYADAGSCAICVLTDVKAAVQYALDFFANPDDLDMPQAPAHLTESAKI